MITLNGQAIRVVDAHVHIFPDELTTAREHWLERDHWFNALYQNPKSKLATAEELIASMDAAGVDFSIVCGFPWSDNAHCDFHNQYMADAVHRYPGRLAWIGIVTPGIIDAATVADRCLASGAVGLGEINADAQSFQWTDSVAIAPLAEVAIRHQKPVLVHASEPLGHDYPGKGLATPDQILALANAFPELKIVAAHWGGGLPFFELMPEVRKSLANLVYDSSATTYLYDQTVFEHVIAIAGAQKVIFASDYPVLSQTGLINRMSTVKWASSNDARLAMSSNAERIYGLAGPR